MLRLLMQIVMNSEPFQAIDKASYPHKDCEFRYVHGRAVERKTYEYEGFWRNPGVRVVVVVIVTRGRVVVPFKTDTTDNDDDLKDQSNNGKDGSNSANSQFPETLVLFSFCLSKSHR
jgi:hypothetical protein